MVFQNLSITDLKPSIAKLLLVLGSDLLLFDSNHLEYWHIASIESSGRLVWGSRCNEWPTISLGWDRQ